VYEIEFPIFSNYFDYGFWLRFLDDTGIINTAEYHEMEGKLHEYGMENHQFVFDLDFVPNQSYLFYK
jgi:hypothetical protein